MVERSHLEAIRSFSIPPSIKIVNSKENQLTSSREEPKENGIDDGGTRGVDRQRGEDDDGGSDCDWNEDIVCAQSIDEEVGNHASDDASSI